MALLEPAEKRRRDGEALHDRVQHVGGDAPASAPFNPGQGQNIL